MLEHYPDFKEWLTKNHFLQEGEPTEVGDIVRYERTEFSLEAAIGLVVQSVLSGRPIRNFQFTDDGVWVMDLTNGSDEMGRYEEVDDNPRKYVDDVVREDMMAWVLGVPYELHKIGMHDGHVKLADYSGAFSGYLNAISNPFEVSPFEHVINASGVDGDKVEAIRADEYAGIRRRLKRNEHLLGSLLLAMGSEISPMPHYARILRDNLTYFGYGSD
tara:strand:+ start:1731 stop:2378 length:648 start_codon:yes stop_codon:yes gene_type:complete